MTNIWWSKSGNLVRLEPLDKRASVFFVGKLSSMGKKRGPLCSVDGPFLEDHLSDTTT